MARFRAWASSRRACLRLGVRRIGIGWLLGLWSGMVLVGTRGRELVGMAGVRAWDWSRHALERLSLI